MAATVRAALILLVVEWDLNVGVTLVTPSGKTALLLTAAVMGAHRSQVQYCGSGQVQALGHQRSYTVASQRVWMQVMMKSNASSSEQEKTRHNWCSW